jgi:hypothetical protein
MERQQVNKLKNIYLIVRWHYQVKRIKPQDFGTPESGVRVFVA